MDNGGQGVSGTCRQDAVVGSNTCFDLRERNVDKTLERLPGSLSPTTSTPVDKSGDERHRCDSVPGRVRHGAGRSGIGAAAACQRQRTAMNRPDTIRPKPIAKFHELRSFMIGTFSPAR